MNRRSLVTSYSNLVSWRNDFAHEGRVPAFATFDEVAQAYEDGKEVVLCFEGCLKR